MPVEAGERLAVLTPPGMEERDGGHSEVIFQCEDVQATYKTLKERGVLFTQELVELPGGVMALFVDPDGNKFVLCA
jgi:predicted enzyme related to lactoylglutathione lyase